jgi:NTE family protein
MSDHPKVTARETIRAVSGGTAAPVDVALPRDFGARYGDGVSRGLCLGGGGLFFIAWQIAYLQTLASEGIPVDASDRMVGTSAGSFVASALAGGHLGRVRLEMSVLASLSSLFSVRTSEPNLRTSQQRALDLLMEADDSYDDTVRAIGHAALAAITPSQRAMRHTVGLLIGARHWPTTELRITCVDAYTAERCVIANDAGVPLMSAVAASCSIPGVSSTQPIGDRRCMDGGVSGTSTHLDLLAGARRALVLSLGDGTDSTAGMGTSTSAGVKQEIEDFAQSGTDIVFRFPEEVDPEQLMSAEAVPGALAMGARQGAADVSQLSSFWR